MLVKAFLLRFSVRIYSKKIYSQRWIAREYQLYSKMQHILRRLRHHDSSFHQVDMLCLQRCVTITVINEIHGCDGLH